MSPHLTSFSCLTSCSSGDDTTAFDRVRSLVVRVTRWPVGWVPSRDRIDRDQPHASAYATHRTPGLAARHQPYRPGHHANPRVFRSRRLSQDHQRMAAARERVLRRREPRRKGVSPPCRRAVAQAAAPRVAQGTRPRRVGLVRLSRRRRRVAFGDTSPPVHRHRVLARCSASVCVCVSSRWRCC